MTEWACSVNIHKELPLVGEDSGCTLVAFVSYFFTAVLHFLSVHGDTVYK